MSFSSQQLISQLDRVIDQCKDCQPIEIAKQLVANGLDDIPLPASGDTLQRWQVLAHMATFELSTAKFFESHCDAKAILAELKGPEFPEDALWGVWCAEPPQFRVEIDKTDGIEANQQVQISGTKAWCSGADGVTHALVSVWYQQEPYLVAVAMDEATISIDKSGWHAIGMQQTNSFNVTFNNTNAIVIGEANTYTERPGFVHGAAGVACCWYGALTKVASYVKNSAHQNPNPYRLAHLGAIDALLAASASLIRETAQILDNNPKQDNLQAISRMRLAIEDAAEQILLRASRALGTVPFCLDAEFAQYMVDVPVFIRQSHAEHDQASLAKQVLKRELEQWML